MNSKNKKVNNQVKKVESMAKVNIKQLGIQFKETKSEKILLIINAEDQNWGGTGHINVRYTLNGDKTDIGFFINRNFFSILCCNSKNKYWCFLLFLGHKLLL